MNTFENRDMFIEIGLNISFYRRKRGMTQDMLADLINGSICSFNSISTTIFILSTGKPRLISFLLSFLNELLMLSVSIFFL